MAYRWQPGTFPDAAALARMASHFPHPNEMMGEAWFMGHRRKLHAHLLSAPLAELPVGALIEPLWDITSGTNCFGHLPEWDTWLRHLLPTLIARGGEGFFWNTLFELTVSAVMAIFEDNLSRDYAEFPQDLIATLGVGLMAPAFWQPDHCDPAARVEYFPRFLSRSDNGTERLANWHDDEAPGTLCAGMGFAIRYLPTTDFAAWVDSLFAIRHSHWRAALLLWYVGAHRLAQTPGRTVQDMDRLRPSITWENSFALGAEIPLFPASRLALCLAEFRRHLTLDQLVAWEAEFGHDPVLAQQINLDTLMRQVMDTLVV